MYAIIRTGGKQAKVHEGDVLDVELLREQGEVTFTPLLIVGDDGTVVSGRKNLESARVVATVLGESAGDKIDIFKYKAKTGYRRRQGHRQRYTRIEVTAIEAPGTKKPAAKPKAAKPKAKAKPAPKDEAGAEAAAKPADAEKSAQEASTAEKPAAAKKKTTETAEE